MQLTKTIFQNSAIFIEKKGGRKSVVREKWIFCGEKELIHLSPRQWLGGQSQQWRRRNRPGSQRGAIGRARRGGAVVGEAI